MGIQDYMQKVDRTNTIQFGGWIRSSGSIIILGTYPMRSNNHQHDRMSSSRGKAKSADGDGKR
jgi:hypothetical protein